MLGEIVVSVGLIVILGGVLCSFLILTQTDLKALIAYSRISHIAAIIGLALLNSSLGLIGGVIIRVGHGLTRSGLFYLVTLQYNRIGSRSIIISKGLLVIFPLLRIRWSLLILANLSAPPRLNLIREFFMFNIWIGL